MAKLWAHVSDPPPQPQRDAPRARPRLRRGRGQATAKDPGDRYATAGEMATAARDAIALQQQAQSAASARRSASCVRHPRRPRCRADPDARADPAARAGAGRAGVVDGRPPPSTRASAPALGRCRRSPSPRASAQPSLEPAGPPGAAGRRVAATACAPTGLALRVRRAQHRRDRARRARRRSPWPRSCSLISGGKDKSSTAATAANKPAAAEPAGDKLAGTLGPVPTNRVTAPATSPMRLDGTTLTVTVDAHGLVDGKHAMHIHAGARGVCPPASAGEAPQRPPGDQHRRRRAVLRAAGASP